MTASPPPIGSLRQRIIDDTRMRKLSPKTQSGYIRTVRLESLSTRQLNRVIHAAAEAAQIDKRVSMHTLRHSFATHLLEQKVDIRAFPVKMGWPGAYCQFIALTVIHAKRVVRLCCFPKRNTP